jgi:hypothetical protein
MSTDNPNPDNTNNTDSENSNNTTPPTGVSMTPEQLEKLISDRLNPIKEKLDSAFVERDAAKTRLAELEKEKQEQEIKRLQEEGKHKEAYEIQLAEERAKLSRLEKQNTELARDASLRTLLGKFTFRSDSASNMAYNSIISELKQNDKGDWVHASGTTLADYVKVFSENEENSFLFKPKVSSGAGLEGNNNPPPVGEYKSIYEMSQEEVLKRITEGKPLPKRK